MAETIDDIASKTLREIRRKLILLDNHNGANQTPEEKKELAINVIRSEFSSAFEKVEKTQHKDLYRKLARQSHTDKLQTKHPALHNYLSQIDSVNVLMNELEIYNKKNENLVEEVLNNPFEGIKKAGKFFYNLVIPMLNAYKRYPEPIRSIVRIASWIINTVLVVVAIALVIPALLILQLNASIQKYENKILNFITGKQYGKELENYVNDHMPEARAKYAASVKSFSKSLLLMQRLSKEELAKMQAEIDAISEDEVIAGAVREPFMKKMEAFKNKYNVDPSAQEEEQLKAEAVKELVKGHTPSIRLQKVKIVFNAMSQSIINPLPEKNKIGSVFAKCGRVLLFPFVILSSVLTLAMDYASAGIVIGSFAALFAIKVATLAIYNAPLYAYDLLKAGFNFACGKKSESANTNDPDLEMQNDAANDSAAKLSKLGGQSNPAEQTATPHQGANPSTPNQGIFTNTPVIIVEESEESSEDSIYGVD